MSNREPVYDEDRYAHYDEEYEPPVRQKGKEGRREGSLTGLSNYLTRVSNGARKRV